MYKIFLLLFLLLLACINLYAQSEADARDLFMDAKKKCIEQQWREAIGLFEELIQKYPGSRYQDDATFWIAYSLEKIPGSSVEAFFKYSELVEDSPSSPWEDDAMMHQIMLAEQFVRSGEEQYRRFLYEKLETAMLSIRNRAAIALGRLGDRAALDVLQKLRDDADLGALAGNLITLLDKKPLESIPDTSEGAIRLMYEKGFEPLSKGKPEDRGFLWFSSQRYEQYRSMLRNDDDWDRQELSDFALWHIIDTDNFESYRSLSDPYDKEEWLRKFWKERDPTPTTEENELIDEFKRRIDYSRSYFGKFWNYKQFRYLPDQHMRMDWYHAPWDARGELYIKYGEPYARSISGWQTEEWVYYIYGVDFIVRQYMTNIYGNAVFAGPMSQLKYRDYSMPARKPLMSFFGSDFGEYNWYTYNTYLDAEFIYNNEIRYNHKYDAEPLDEIDLSISDQLIRYGIPAEEFTLRETDNKFQAVFEERYVIYNEDYREVSRSESERKVENIIDPEQLIVGNISINLPPGRYKFALRLTDRQGNKMGVYREEFEISR